MTVQIDLRPALPVHREHLSTGRPRNFGPALLLSAIVLASFAGMGVAASLTEPVAPTRVVYQEPNANDREGRRPELPAPNANTREGRIPSATSAGPNANTREDRTR